MLSIGPNVCHLLLSVVRILTKCYYSWEISCVLCIFFEISASLDYIDLTYIVLDGLHKVLCIHVDGFIVTLQDKFTFETWIKVFQNKRTSTFHSTATLRPISSSEKSKNTKLSSENVFWLNGRMKSVNDWRFNTYLTVNTLFFNYKEWTCYSCLGK
jgi:hypothetical protein